MPLPERIPFTPEAELEPIDSSQRRYSSTNIYRYLKVYSEEDQTWGRVEFFENLPVFDIPLHYNDVMHQVGPGDEFRLDLISFRYYGTPLYWWLIALAQDPPIFDPLREVVVDRVLRIPYLAGVISKLAN